MIKVFVLRTVLLLILIFLSQPALAGPWARGVGGTFQSFMLVSSDGQFNADLYTEYGLSPNATLALASSANYPLTTSPTTEIGGQYSLSPFGPSFPIAIGVKAHLPAGILNVNEVLPNLSISPTLSAGSGFDTPLGPAWITADVAFAYSTDFNQLNSNASLQFGLKPANGILLMVNGSYFTQHEYTKTAFSLATAVNFTDNMSVYAEHQWVLDKPRDNTISIGIWIDG